MFSTLVHTALFAVLAARNVAAEIKFNTPSLTQDATLEWEGGAGPYDIYVVPGTDSCADSVVDIPTQSKTSYKWTVNVPAGSNIELMVEDSASEEAWTGVITVGNSTDASCVDKKAAQALNAAAPPSSSSAAASAASSSGAASSVAVATPTAGYQGPAVTVEPASASAAAGLANAANEGTPQSSGSLPSAALPVGSLLATVALFLSVVHL